MFSSGKIRMRSGREMQSMSEDMVQPRRRQAGAKISKDLTGNISFSVCRAKSDDIDVLEQSHAAGYSVPGRERQSSAMRM